MLVEELSVPPDGTHPLSFATHYSRNFMGQFKICLWKNNAVYWRSPDYNSVRFFFTFFLAILFGAHPRRLPHQGAPFIICAGCPSGRLGDQSDILQLTGQMYSATSA